MKRHVPEMSQLRLLVGIAEHGSLGAAARAIGMAQPNATRTLARMERQLGLSLVSRSPAGSRLTTQGTLIVQWARSVLDAADNLMLGAEALRSEQSGQLDVAASMTVAEYLVPPWLGEFRRRHADVHVNLQVHNSSVVFDLVREGKAQLGFVESPTVPTDLASAVVGSDELIVVVAPEHPWARRRGPIPAKELAATPLLVREQGSGTRVTLDSLLADHDRAEPVVEVTSNAAVRVSAVAGMGPAVLSRLAVEGSLERGELRHVRVSDLRLKRTLRAVWDASHQLDDNAAELLSIARPTRTKAGSGRT